MNLVTTSVLTAVALGAAASSLQAQIDTFAQRHTAPTGLVNSTGNDKAVFWTANVSGSPNELLGGSLRTNHASVLRANGPLGQVGAERTVVVQETNTNHYWGLLFDGTWGPQLTLGQTATSVVFSQDMMGLVEPTAIHWFNPWSTGWQSFATTSSAPQVIQGRAWQGVIDGSDTIAATSVFLDTPSVLNLAPNPSRVIVHLADNRNGEADPTRRNTGAFATGANEVQLFSAYTGNYTALTTTSFANSLGVNYDKNVIILEDATGGTSADLHFFSCYADAVVTLPITDIGQVTYDAQDFGAVVRDAATDITYVFRPVDNQLVPIPGTVSVLDTAFGRSSNNQLVFGTLASGALDTIWGISFSARGQIWDTVALAPGEAVLGEDGNDNCHVVATDQRLLGFSSMTNRWVARTYQGTFGSIEAQDFIGKVVTDTHVYAFSPREGRWIERALAAGESVGDTNSSVIVTGNNAISVYSVNATAWRDQALSGPVFADGDNDSYVYSIHDNLATGGSRVYFYGTYQDRWTTTELPVRVDANSFVTELEQGLVIEAAGEVWTFSGFGDLSSVYAAPIDNYAYHAVQNAPARFVAKGTPGALAIVLLGVGRAEQTVPGIRGPVMIDVSRDVFWFIPAQTNYDANGLLRFDLQLFPVTISMNMQMAAVRANGRVDLGRLTIFEIH